MKPVVDEVERDDMRGARECAVHCRDVAMPDFRGDVAGRRRPDQRRARDCRLANRMCRQRQSNETGRSKERVADELFHDWTSEVGGNDFSV